MANNACILLTKITSGSTKASKWTFLVFCHGVVQCAWDCQWFQRALLRNSSVRWAFGDHTWHVNVIGFSCKLWPVGRALDPGRENLCRRQLCLFRGPWHLDYTPAISQQCGARWQIRSRRLMCHGLLSPLLRVSVSL